MLYVDAMELTHEMTLYEKGRKGPRNLLFSLRHQADSTNPDTQEKVVRGFALIAKRQPDELIPKDLENALRLGLGILERERCFTSFERDDYALVNELLLLGLGQYDLEIFGIAIGCLLKLAHEDCNFVLTQGLLDRLGEVLQQDLNCERGMFAREAWIQLAEHIESKGLALKVRDPHDAVRLEEAVLGIINYLDEWGGEGSVRTPAIERAEKIQRHFMPVVADPGAFDSEIRQVAIRKMRVVVRVPTPHFQGRVRQAVH